MSSFVLRPAAPADLSALILIERATSNAPHWPQAEYASILRPHDPQETVARCCFVAELEGKLAGFVVAKAIGRGAEGFAELESVAVDLASRRMGLGRALCEAAIAWCRSLHLGRLELEVRAGSAAAIALYRGLNFVVSGRRAGYYRDPEEDALLMRLDLQNPLAVSS